MDLEVADLEGDEEMVIGRDLFRVLGYEVLNVPFTWPQCEDTTRQPKERTHEEVPEGIGEDGVAPEWKELIEQNQAIPKHHRCQLPGAELAIETTGDPAWVRQYPMPERYKPAVNEKVQEWVDAGLCVPVSPGCQWNTPLLAAKKPSKEVGVPDGIRTCGDFWKVNERITKMPDSNLPTLQEVHDSLKRFKWISVIDFAESYHQFPIREEDQQKTAFTWGRFGQLMFTGVPFGLKIMTGHMQKLMEKLLMPLGIKPFQDDIVIASQTVKEHVRDVRRVLELLTDVGRLRINLKKCQFFKQEARVLGSIIAGDGIRMDPKTIRAIVSWTRPTDGKGMQRFLGAANFHRDFSHEYARIVAPLEELRNVSGDIKWTPERSQAFEDVKKLFASNLSLRTIDWGREIYLTTDASLVGIGAWIGQKNEEGEIALVVCASKKLTATQQRWSATKRELYALMWGMQRMRNYLLGRRFVARVDHKPLVAMMRNKFNVMMEGWVNTIL